MTRQITHVFLRRIIGIAVLHAHRAHRHVGHLRGRHRELHVAERRQLFGYLIVAGQRHANDQLMRCVGACKCERSMRLQSVSPSNEKKVPTLTLFGQSSATPNDGAMMVLVLGLSGCHLDERLLHLIDGAENAFDALDFARPTVSRFHRAVSGG